MELRQALDRLFAIKGDPLAVVALLGLLAGLMVLRLITRPLHRLTETMRNFGSTGEAAPPLPAAPATPSTAMAERDEIAVLKQTFLQKGARIGDRWRHLSQLDQDRRERNWWRTYRKFRLPGKHSAGIKMPHGTV